MSSVYGNILKVSTFGESHGGGIGVVVDGVPAGIELTEEVVQLELDKRRPGTSQFVSPRKEADSVEIVSGVYEGKTIGSPVMMLIRNTNQRSKDYGDLLQKFRPGHADYSYFKKYGVTPLPGGGRSSGRETAGRVAAGVIARLILGNDIIIKSAVTQIGKIVAKDIDYDCAGSNQLRFGDALLLQAAENEINIAKAENDSVGGSVILEVTGLPAGVGEPVFDKLDARIAAALFSIGGVKGVEIGAGFAAAGMRGSDFNDPLSSDMMSPVSNNAGGILGGISSGAPITVRIAIKPTPSIASVQNTINAAGENCDIVVKGRHDPCICPRVAIVAEAMMALALADLLLEHKARYTLAE